MTVSDSPSQDPPVPPASATDEAPSFPPLKPATPFAEELLSRVQGFSCGGEAWEQDVARWIQLPRGQGGALDAMADLGTEVWLYERTDGQVVGFGSLGVTTWRYPNPKKSDRVAVQIVPYFGIRHEYKGLPPAPCPREERYAFRIFADLLAKARERIARSDLLGLLVHRDNARAIAFYQRFGFQVFTQRGDLTGMIVGLAGASD
jgi:hypothetical protein